MNVYIYIDIFKYEFNKISCNNIKKFLILIRD